jgi:ribonucleoside-diphosphate reductase alpha chain
MFRSQVAETTFNDKYKHEGAEDWRGLSKTLVDHVLGDEVKGQDWSEIKKNLTRYITEMKFIPGGRYIYYAGRLKPFFNNCYLLKAEEDTREDWAELAWKAESCLLTGGGIGVDYSIYRPSGSVIKRTGGSASGPIPKMDGVNAQGRYIMQGGSRRSAIYASLNWRHADIDTFLTMKDWDNQPLGTSGLSYGDMKRQDFNFSAPLDMTNVSVNYDTNWLMDYYKTGEVGEVFHQNVLQAMKNGEPGFSFNFFEKENETLRNACTEVTSEDDSDVCNLGSLNLGRISSLSGY